VVATRFEPSLRRTLTATAEMGASDMEPLFNIELRAFVAPTGVEIGAARPRTNEDEQLSSFSLRFTRDGAAWQAQGYVDQSGHIGPRSPEVEQGVGRIGSGSMYMVQAAIEGVRLDRHRDLVLGDGDAARQVRLSGRHRRFAREEGFDASSSVVALGDAHLLVLTTSYGQGTLDGTPLGPYAVSRVDRRAATAELLLHGEDGDGTVVGGEEGAAYVQVAGALYRVTASGRPERLRAGLLITK
jgi:hypothetical protein